MGSACCSDDVNRRKEDYSPINVWYQQEIFSYDGIICLIVNEAGMDYVNF